MILVARALAGLLVFGEKTIACSAHRQGTSRELFRALKSFFDNFDDLRRRVGTINGALGREVIELRGGARVLFPARTRQSVRGLGFDLYLADESAVGHPGAVGGCPANDVHPQCPPGVDVRDRTAVGHRRGGVRQDARGRARRRTGSGLDRVRRAAGCDLDDQDQWRQANPGRVQVSAMETERRDLSPAGSRASD